MFMHHYLFISNAEEEGEEGREARREAKRFSSHWFTPQRIAKARSRPGGSQKYSQSTVAYVDSRGSVPESSSIASQKHYQGTRLKCR